MPSAKHWVSHTLAALCALALCTACTPPGKTNLSNGPAPRAAEGASAPVHKKQVLSRSYHIDKKYKSMMGPDSLDHVHLLDSEEPELVWIVGYEATVVDDDGQKQTSQEFMCHANLDFEPERHWEDFKSDAAVSGRLFTLSQGQQKVRFPDGYGIPMVSTTRLGLATQVLNLNIDKPDLDVRHKVTIEFVRDKETTTPMKPLFQAAVQGFKSLEDAPAHYGIKSEDLDEHAGCAVGMPAVKGDVSEDGFGKKFTGHWIVKPGREETRTVVNKFLQLRFDTTVHYIAVHMHPTAESLELIDLTAKKTVFKAKVTAADKGIGIKHIEHFESVEGAKLFKDHNYELVSVYNNTTGKDVDSMAVMYLYLHDNHFKKPTPEEMRAAAKKQKEGPKPDKKAKKGMGM